MIRSLVLSIAIVWSLACTATADESPQNFFRVDQSSAIGAPQALNRNGGYFRMLVHDTNIYATRDINRPLLDWFRDQISPNRRAVAHIRLVMGSGNEKRVTATNFAEIYDEFATDNRKKRYVLRDKISAGGLDLLQTTRVPEKSAPRIHIGYYGVVEEHQGGGITTTLNSFLPVILSPKIGAATKVVDEAVSAYEKVTTYLYDNTGRGRLFAGAVTDDPFTNGGVLSQSGFWLLSHDLAGKASTLIVDRDNNGYHRLHYKTAEGTPGPLVTDKTYALVEVRSVSTRITGPDADVGKLTEVMAQFSKALDRSGATGVSITERRAAATEFFDWMLSNAALELSNQDMASLAKQVIHTAIERECSRALFVNISTCKEEQLNELQKPVSPDATAVEAAEAVLKAQDTLRTLDARETLLTITGMIKADGTVDNSKRISGLSAESILNSEPDTLTQQFSLLQNQTMIWSNNLGVIEDFKLQEHERLELELNAVEQIMDQQVIF